MNIYILVILLLIIYCIFLYKINTVWHGRVIQDNKLQEQIENLRKTENQLRRKIAEEQFQYQILSQKNQDFENLISDRKNNLSNTYNNLQESYKENYYKYIETLDAAYSQKENQFKQSLDQLKNELSNVAAAKTREEEIKDKINFYKIQITEKQKSDIQMLQQWKYKLFDPSLVSKVIWSSYIMKPTSDLCNRITLGKTTCGIYKITSLTSQRCYIGQSVNISDRIKSHVKCGLGIDAPASNKLYNLMQKEGVYNFTFEILQVCEKNKLNERERFWIETYQSNKFGLNIQGGNK